MVEQLNAFASEVTRVAREVGSEAILGGQARVPRRGRRVEGSDGQLMASNLASQVRDIALGPRTGRGRRRSVAEDHRQGRGNPQLGNAVQHDGGEARR